MEWTFPRLTESDLPTLFDWLRRPHVVEHWGRCASLEAVREEYLPAVPDRWSAEPYLACFDGLEVGYIQSYVAYGAGNGWWPGEDDSGVRGIDQFLADEANLGLGLGTSMIGAFVTLLFQDPAVTRILVDPAPDNLRAIRCYEKVGFRRAGLVTTPDGEAMLMFLERSE